MSYKAFSVVDRKRYPAELARFLPYDMAYYYLSFDSGQYSIDELRNDGVFTVTIHYPTVQRDLTSSGGQTSASRGQVPTAVVPEGFATAKTRTQAEFEIRTRAREELKSEASGRGVANPTIISIATVASAAGRERLLPSIAAATVIDTTRPKEDIIIGQLDLRTNKINGAYYIIKTQDLLNFMMHNSKMEGRIPEAQVKRGPEYFDRLKQIWRESGNYKVFDARVNSIIMEQYQNYKLTVRTIEFLGEPYYKITELYSNDKIYLSTTYDADEIAISYLRTSGVSKNEKFNEPFADQVEDSADNELVRRQLKLERPTAETSYIVSKTHPLAQAFLSRNDNNNEVIIRYSPNAVIYSLTVSHPLGNSLTLIDEGLVGPELIDYTRARVK